MRRDYGAEEYCFGCGTGREVRKDFLGPAGRGKKGQPENKTRKTRGIECAANSGAASQDARKFLITSTYVKPLNESI